MSHEAHDGLTQVEDAFTDQQWSDYHQEDVKAGSAVVMLMLGIFGVGVILYAIVAVVVSL